MLLGIELTGPKQVVDLVISLMQGNGRGLLTTSL